MIEKGLRIVEKEVGVWRGRVDLIGYDSSERLCVIDVTLSHSIGTKKKKMLKYRSWIQMFATRIFGLPKPTVRLFIATPGGVIEVG